MITDSVKLVFGRLLVSYIPALVIAMGLDVFRINLFGVGTFDQYRNAFLLGTFLLCLSLFVVRSSRERLLTICILPFLTQFYDVALGWDFPPGSQSLIRLVPFAAIFAAMVGELLRHPYKPGRNEQAGIAICVLLGLFAALSSIDISPVSWVGFFFLSLLLPVFYLFVRSYSVRYPELGSWLCAGALAGFLVLGFGTMVVIRLGEGLTLGGSQGLLATRSVSDFNVVLGYLVLAWPFALWAAKSIGWWVSAGIALLFTAVSFYGLSRVGIMLTPLLIFSSLLVIYQGQGRQLLKVVGASSLLVVLAFVALPNRDDLMNNWVKRFNVTNLSNVLEILERVRPGGEDSLARDSIRAEAVRLFEDDPVLGNGFGGFRRGSKIGYTDAHSITFSVLAEWGIFGLAAAYGLFAVIGMRLLGASSKTRNRWQMGMVMLLGFLAWLAVGHTVGGGFLMIAESGFAANALPALLLALYLRPDTFQKPELAEAAA